jgi:2-polyprenyl-3-methyl-5-hydroxy-6-metoxy-1,4-benzoquinol methylase
MIARENGIDTICDFFNEDVAAQILHEKGAAAVITATNVLAHVNDVDAFVESVKLLLAQRGVFIFEAPYFANLLKLNEYDTIYHEHLSYLSVKPLVPFFRKHGLGLRYRAA